MRHLLLCALLACGGGSGASEHAAAPPQEPEVPPTTAAVLEVAPSIDPAAEPVLRIWAQPNADATTLHVQNRGGEPVRLRSMVKLETHADDGWREVAIGFSLRRDCQTVASECITLAPGGEFIPPDWSGDVGDGQCDCARCGPMDPGAEVRFIIESCAPEGAIPHRMMSEAFSVPG